MSWGWDAGLDDLKDSTGISSPVIARQSVSAMNGHGDASPRVSIPGVYQYFEYHKYHTNCSPPPDLQPTTYDWDWCDRGSSHVEFTREEKVPLVEGRLLGHGVHGGVYETVVQGKAIAWKRKFTRRQLGDRERKEIDILKKLRHRHIIQLVGTYTKGPIVGLLLYPVATCDLASFMEDVDHLYHEDSDGHDASQYALSRLRISHLLCEDTPNQDSISTRLYNTIGCTASAIAYLHDNKIKHKDLKPANILLGQDGRLWLTDFGTSSDFSTDAESVTEGGERGTPKYFAPEVAAYEGAGRSAEMFSFGCIILEIVGICNGYSLKELEALRPARDRSFHANLDHIVNWFNVIALNSLRDTFLMTDVRMMLRHQPPSRPGIKHLNANLQLLDEIVGPTKLCQTCCAPIHIWSKFGQVKEMEDLTITYGNSYEDRPGETRFKWCFFLWPSNPDVIDKVICFLVSVPQLMFSPS
ncbi:kinase-like protein [Pseudovirgaria hyperparasitica]|uniref:Kinase-like protein n=1 Tax=Pseudovirgaria hyperparasitica TaxID=470096 RepID=A0A6A6WLK2_9PEZI|nr:kinase-like protein [Pseudovirgaria hyperparasitica]KAF2763061.1 kinase-like protein [Pseudovirgaria hyperparasitica]